MMNHEKQEHSDGKQNAVSGFPICSQNFSVVPVFKKSGENSDAS